MLHVLLIMVPMAMGREGVGFIVPSPRLLPYRDGVGARKIGEVVGARESSWFFTNEFIKSQM